MATSKVFSGEVLLEQFQEAPFERIQYLELFAEQPSFGRQAAEGGKGFLVRHTLEASSLVRTVFCEVCEADLGFDVRTVFRDLGQKTCRLSGAMDSLDEPADDFPVLDLCCHDKLLDLSFR